MNGTEVLVRDIFIDVVSTWGEGNGSKVKKLVVIDWFHVTHPLLLLLLLLLWESGDHERGSSKWWI
jgi:hypothetical protein